MITSIHIRGFKSLQHESLDIGNVNVFIGANGSGKSNILEAVGVLSAASSSNVDDESLMRRGVRPGLPTLYKSSFKRKRTPSDIYFEVHSSDNICYKVALYNPLERPAKAWKYKSESMSIGEKNLFSDGVRTWQNKEVGLAATALVSSMPDSEEVTFLRTLQDYAIYTPNTPTLRGLLPDSVRGAVGLQGGGLAEAMEELLKSESEKEYFEEALGLLDWVENVEISKSASLLLSPSVPRQQKILIFQDRFMSQERNQLTAYDASEGALYVLLSLVLARSMKMGPLFAVDNFDQALNPRLAKKLIQYFCRWMLLGNSMQKQVFLTVHSPTVLDGLPINDDRVRLFVVDRDDQGFTKIKRILITPEIKQLSQDNGWPLSRLWIMGHLGGIPNV